MTQEIYALCKDRTSAHALCFINTFLPNGIPFAEDYPVPECSDNPTHLFKTIKDVIEFLEVNPLEPYGLYWNADSGQSEIVQAMLFYTRDNCVILGLAVSPESAANQMRRLKEFANTEYAVLGDEQRPPETSSEFIKFCQQ